MTNHVSWFRLAAVAVLVCLAGPALAAPSFFGYTGLVGVPTAEALDKDDYNAAAFTLNFEEGGDSSIYAANLGVADGLEIGFARFRPEEGEGETSLNAKYRFSPETGERPALAAGVVDFADEVDTTVYVVMSKSLVKRYEMSLGEIVSPQIHFGVGGGQFDGVFGGLSAALADRLMLTVEHDSEEINFGARLALSDELRAHFAALDGFDDIGLGLSYNKSF
jgi:hypothetical protein